MLGVLANLPVNFQKWALDVKAAIYPKNRVSTDKIGGKWVWTATYQIFLLKIGIFSQNDHYLVLKSIKMLLERIFYEKY